MIKTTLLDGRDYFTVERKCSGLRRFMGQSGQNSLKDFVFFEELRARRNAMMKDGVLKQLAGLHKCKQHGMK